MTQRATSAPDVTTLIADRAGAVVGAGQMLSDRAVEACLRLVVVHPEFRGRSLGRQLIDACSRRAGSVCIDLLMAEEAAAFYKSLSFGRLPSFRLYAAAPVVPLFDCPSGAIGGML